MSYEDMRDFQRREEQGDDYVPESPAFTADEVAEYRHDNLDDPDCEVLSAVMHKAMAERLRVLEARVAHLRALVRELGGGEQ